jgi:glycosyltransferase involved in cell wall biosynthesis
MKCKAVVLVLTLNEVKNIYSCILSIRSSDFSDVFVLDGGSTDGTLEILNDLNIPHGIYKNTTISDRRSLGLKYAESNNYKFALFLDADQVILEPNALYKSINYFQSNEYLAAIQYNLITPLGSKNLNYWQRGFYYRHSIINSIGKKVVLGTPTFISLDRVSGFSYKNLQITGPSDDTYFFKQISKSGLELECVSISSSENVRATLKSTFRKAFWYGIGDVQYVHAEPNSRLKFNHIYHVFVRNTLILPFQKVNLYTFFLAFFGISRITGYLYYAIFRPSKFINKS